MITVALTALLDHPTQRELQVLTPGVDLDRSVAGIRLIRDLTARPTTAAHAALLVLDEVSRTDWRLDALISRAHAAYASLLIVPGVEPLRLPTQLLAQRLSLPVVGTTDPLAAFGTLTNLLSGASAEVARTIVATEAACRQAGAGTAEVISAFAAALGREVAMLDHAARAVVGGELFDEAARVVVVDQLTGRRSAELSAKGARSTDRTEVIELPDHSQLLAMQIAPGQGSWLAVRLPHPMPVEREAISASMSIASGAIRERRAQRRMELERNARARTSTLSEVTRPPYPSSPTSRRRALALGWDLEGWHIGVHAGVIEEVDLADLRADLIEAFRSVGLAVEAVEQADGWALWTTTSREPSATDAVTHAEAIRLAQRGFESGVAVRSFVGVGRPRPGAEGLARSLAESLDAARLARVREETGRFLHVDRLGFGQLLLGWTRTDSFRPAAEALLEPLARTPGELRTTLGTYLDQESSIAHTAAVLGVHRNTVAARIARVQDLLGVDLTNPDERLALHLACKALLGPEQAMQNTHPSAGSPT